MYFSFKWLLPLLQLKSWEVFNLEDRCLFFQTECFPPVFILSVHLGSRQTWCGHQWIILAHRLRITPILCPLIPIQDFNFKPWSHHCAIIFIFTSYFCELIDWIDSADWFPERYRQVVLLNLLLREVAN